MLKFINFKFYACCAIGCGYQEALFHIRLASISRDGTLLHRDAGLKHLDVEGRTENWSNGFPGIPKTQISPLLQMDPLRNRSENGKRVSESTANTRATAVMISNSTKTHRTQRLNLGIATAGVGNCTISKPYILISRSRCWKSSSKSLATCSTRTAAAVAGAR